MEPGGEGDVEIDIDSALEPGRPSGGARAVTRKSGGGGRKSAPSKPAKPASKPAKAAAKPAKKAQEGRETRQEGCETCEKGREEVGQQGRQEKRPRAKRADVVNGRREPPRG